MEGGTSDLMLTCHKASHIKEQKDSFIVRGGTITRHFPLFREANVALDKAVPLEECKRRYAKEETTSLPLLGLGL